MIRQIGLAFLLFAAVTSVYVGSKPTGVLVRGLSGEAAVRTAGASGGWSEGIGYDRDVGDRSGWVGHGGSGGAGGNAGGAGGGGGGGGQEDGWGGGGGSGGGSGAGGGGGGGRRGWRVGNGCLNGRCSNTVAIGWGRASRHRSGHSGLWGWWRGGFGGGSGKGVYGSSRNNWRSIDGDPGGE